MSTKTRGELPASILKSYEVKEDDTIIGKIVEDQFVFTIIHAQDKQTKAEKARAFMDKWAGSIKITWDDVKGDPRAEYLYKKHIARPDEEE